MAGEGSRRQAERASRALALCLALALASNWILVRMLFSAGPASMLGVVVTLLLGLMGASIAGLAMVRPWGFYAAYALVPVATILHGIALVPFVTDLLPSLVLRIWSVFVLNLAFLIATVLVHRAYRQGRSASAVSAASTHVEIA